MSKGIILTPTQIKANENGATMFIFHIGFNEWIFERIGLSDARIQKPNELFAIFRLHKNSNTTQGYRLPVKKGDKDIFVQENFTTDPIIKEHILYESNFDGESFEDFCEHIGAISKFASQMSKEQSRYSFSECIDVKVVKIREITPKEFVKAKIVTQYEFEEQGFEIIKYRMNEQLKEQNINRTYEDNDYVFLVEFKR